jgi:ATP/maltotriose-dependent transcriptional regulator MalT
MNQMLRIAFKKFLFLSKKYERYGLEELLYNDKRDSKLIYNHSEGLAIRFQLIDLYFDSETNVIPRLQRISVDLNEYLTTKISERLNYAIENIEPIGPVTKKL